MRIQQKHRYADLPIEIGCVLVVELMVDTTNLVKRAATLHDIGCEIELHKQTLPNMV